MPPTLDIGALSGRVELEDRFSSPADLIINKIDKLDARFGGIGSRIAESAAGFFTAEAAFRAVSAGVEFLASTIQQLTVGGAGIADVVGNFDTLTTSIGRLSSTLLNELREGTHATVTDLELIKLANRDLSAGMNLTDQQFRTLADGAFALAQATGTDVKQALDTMNDAMLTGRTRTIALLTGKIDLEEAEKKFATALSTTADRLTGDEKLMAARAAILESVTAATQRLGEQTDGLDEIVAQAQTAWANFRNELAANVATSPVLIEGFMAVRDVLLEAFGGDQRTAIETVTRLIENAAITVIDFAQVTSDTVGVAGRTWHSFLIIIESIANGWRAIEFGVVKLGQVILQVADLASFGLLDLGHDIEVLGGTLDDIYNRLAAGVNSIEAHKTAQDEWSVSTGKVNEALERIKQRMLDAQEAQDAAKASTEQLSGAQEQAAAATDEHAGASAGLATQTRMTATEQEKLRQAIQNVIEAGTGWQDVLSKIPEQLIDTVKEKLAAKVALDDLALAYGLTKAQINAINESFKEEQKALQEATEAAKKKEEALTELMNIGKSWEDTVARLSAKTLEQARAWLEAGAAADKVKIALGLTDTQIQAIQKSIGQATNETEAFTQALRSQEDALDATAIKVRTLSGEMITLAEAQARQGTGGSFEINRGNLDENLRTWGIPTDFAFTMAEAGASFQEILAAWQGQVLPRDWKPSGPRIPGFGTGALVTEPTFAMIGELGPEAVIPLDGGENMLGVTNVFYVNGTAEDVANKISDVLMRRAKLGRRFGVA